MSLNPKITLTVLYQLTIIVLALLICDYLKEREKTKQVIGGALQQLIIKK